MYVPKKQWDGWPCAAGSAVLGARGAQSAGLALCPNACLLSCISRSQMAQGHPFVMFALGGAVGAAASQGYALLPRQPLTCLLAVLVRHAVMCTVHHATPSTCTCLTQEKDEVAWSTQQRKKLCEAGAATSANAAKWLLLHDMPCLFRYGLVKWDGTALCDSALQSLSAKLSSLSADVRAWGGVPFAYCTLGLAGLILG